MDRPGLSKTERLTKRGCTALLLVVPACIGCAMLLTMLHNRLSAIFIISFLILVAVAAFRSRRGSVIASVNQAPSDSEKQQGLGKVVDAGSQAVQGIAVSIDVLPQKPSAEEQAGDAQRACSPGMGITDESSDQKSKTKRADSSDDKKKSETV
jgi:hypothetical protein